MPNKEFCRRCGSHNPPRTGEGFGPCCPIWRRARASQRPGETINEAIVRERTGWGRAVLEAGPL